MENKAVRFYPLMQTMLKDDEAALPVGISYLPEMYRRKAEIELKETPDKRTKGLRFLREMAKADKNLSEIAFEDDFLQQFLRFSKYNLERALSQLRNHVHYRGRYPGMFRGVDQHVLDIPTSRYCTVLPRRCPEGCTIVLFELGKWDPSEMECDDFQRVITLLYYQSLRHPMAQINGFKAIHDFTGTGARHLRQVTPTRLWHVHYGGLHCYPSRFKEIHMVSKSATMTMVWSIAKHMLSEKIRSRVIFHSEPESLLNHFPRSVLPVHYGGDLENYYMGEWLREANQQQGMSTIGGQRNVI